MSWATCYSGSNNIHFNFPPIMADGRTYSSWQPEAVVNQKLQQETGIKTSWQYRQYLTNNARQIMKMNNKVACTALGLPVHTKVNTTPSSNVPYLYTSVMDTENPGFGYPTSDLRSPYLTREQLQARTISPSIYYTPPNPKIG